MLKLFKYEMYSRIRLMMAVVIGIFLANLLIAYKIDPQDDLIVGLSFLALFTAGVIAFFNGIIVFKRDLYSETGYLIYTLPKKAYYIVNTKLAAAMLETFVYCIVGGSFFIIRLIRVDEENLREMTKIMSTHKLEMFESVVLLIITLALTFLIAYFSLALSRATFGNRRFGEFLAIIIFFVIIIVLGMMTNKISDFFTSLSYYRTWGVQPFIVLSIIGNLFLCILAIVGTHFVIEKKVDI